MENGITDIPEMEKDEYNIVKYKYSMENRMICPRFSHFIFPEKCHFSKFSSPQNGVFFKKQKKFFKKMTLKIRGLKIFFIFFSKNIWR
jgi:hypothetical protein